MLLLALPVWSAAFLSCRAKLARRALVARWRRAFCPVFVTWGFATALDTERAHLFDLIRAARPMPPSRRSRNLSPSGRAFSGYWMS